VVNGGITGIVGEYHVKIGNSILNKTAINLEQVDNVYNKFKK